MCYWLLNFVAFALFALCHCWRTGLQGSVRRVTLIHLEACHSLSVHANLSSVNSACCFRDTSLSLTVTNAIGQRLSICSLFTSLLGCVACFLPLFLRCCCAVSRCWSESSEPPGAGSGMVAGQFLHMPWWSVIVLDAGRDSWPWFVSFLLRHDFPASLQKKSCQLSLRSNTLCAWHYSP